MARPFSTGDAKKLLEEHRALQAALAAAGNEADLMREEVRVWADRLVAQEVLKILRDVPIEEINRGKRGLRVKALRENGFATIADAATASAQTLAAVNGVSEDGAFAIRAVVEDIIEKTWRDVHVRLSSDDRSTAASQLVTAISKLRRGGTVAADCRALLLRDKPEIDLAMNDLEAAAGVFSWFFASGEKRRRAIGAFGVLSALLEGAYGRDAAALTQRFRKIRETTEEEAWQDFNENSVSFINILEDVCPGVLGGGDSVYGLPEDLAHEIAEEGWSPDGLLCRLRRYQEWGVKYILHQGRVLLGDEMGLGKTVQAIAAMVSLRNTGATHFLVVCPAGVLANWCREIGRKSDLPVTGIHGPGKGAALQSWLRAGGVAVTTYETTAAVSLPEDMRVAMLVVDEAHYIKNPDTQRSANVRALCARADRLLFMTGTALENRVDEMIELIRILRPEIARSVQSKAFLVAAPQFRAAVAPVYYRRKREDVLTELPELIESREWCTLGVREELLYELAVLDKNYADARRVSWVVEDLRHSSKARRMLELVAESAEDQRKILVFSFFLETLRKVKELLGERCMGPIDGSVPPQRRQEIIDAFDAAPAGTVLAAQIQSGGTGLNIQSASVVILCEPQFKPSSENQAISRAYRMGQTRHVLVYRLLCENTVDEKILDILESKQTIFDAFADRSVAADESMSIDDRTFGSIIREEIDRINAKRAGGESVGAEDGEAGSVPAEPPEQ